MERCGGLEGERLGGKEKEAGANAHPNSRHEAVEHGHGANYGFHDDLGDENWHLEKSWRDGNSRGLMGDPGDIDGAGGFAETLSK